MRDYEKIWNDLQVGDFISSYNEIQKGEGRGQKILAKQGELIFLSYCENSTDHWENHCNNESKAELIQKLRDDDARIVHKDRCSLNIIKSGNRNNNMKITNLVKKILDKDTRTLVKAGFINGDLALTDDGVAELLGILFLEKKDELVKIADEKLNETD